MIPYNVVALDQLEALSRFLPSAQIKLGEVYFISSSLPLASIATFFPERETNLSQQSFLDESQQSEHASALIQGRIRQSQSKLPRPAGDTPPCVPPAASGEGRPRCPRTAASKPSLEGHKDEGNGPWCKRASNYNIFHSGKVTSSSGGVRGARGCPSVLHRVEGDPGRASVPLHHSLHRNMEISCKRCNASICIVD